MARSRASAKKAGTSFETEMSRYLSEHTGIPVTRRAKTGAVDLGDLTGVTHQSREIAVECKSPGRNSSWSISGWWKETETEAENLGAPFGILLVRRYRKSIAQSLVVVDDHAAEALKATTMLNVVEKKAHPFKDLAEELTTGDIIRTPRRGTKESWWMTTIEDILPLLDNAEDHGVIYLSDDDLSAIREDGQVIKPDTTGGVVVVRYQSS